MLSYCLKCIENTDSKNPKVARTKNGRMMLYVPYVIVIDQNLSNSKNLVDY